MSIYVIPGQEFEASLQTGETGLVGQVGLTLKEGTNEVQARSTTGIVEDPPGSGDYMATRTAPLTEDTYRLVWDVNETLGQYAEEDLIVSPSAPPGPVDGINPTVAEVAALIRARTVDSNSNELGTFTSATRPTTDEVITIIGEAASSVAARVGTNICTEVLTKQARSMVALYAAMIIELSYFPEQSRNDQSPYAKFKELWDDGIKNLGMAISEKCADNDVVGGVEQGSGAFPPAGLWGQVSW